MKIFLLRHTQTSDSASHVNGSRRDLHLSVNGIQQANDLIPSLEKNLYDMIFVSPLARSYETVEPYIKKAKFKHPILKDELLNERDLGIYTGTKEGIVAAEMSKGGQQKVEWIPKGGESTRMVYERAQLFYQKLKKISVDSVLVCAHQNILRCLELIIMNLPLTDDNYYNYVPPRLDYGEIREF